jgi:hypothetical protein
VSPRLTSPLLAAAVCLVAGCMGSGDDSSMSVTGLVTVGGVAWKQGGSVLFESDATSETSTIDAEGRFALRLRPATYRVAVEPAGGIPVERPDPKRGGILPKYMAPSTSGITVSIDDGHRDLVIELDGV